MYTADMNVDDAIAHFCSRMPDHNKTSFFFIGDLIEAYTATGEILKDIWDSCSQRIPFPFSDVTLLASISASEFMALRFIEQAIIDTVIADDAALLMDASQKERVGVNDMDLFKIKIATPLQQFQITALGPRGQCTWSSQFCGIDPKGGITLKSIPPEPITQFVSEMVGGASSWCRLLAMISHPANYIVKETPLLTQKEARKVEEGKRFPNQKRSRYIIVDHEVLVNRLKPQSTHASPVPHQRRGHWMRLSERCKHARARGSDRVWVKDCNVGESDFVVSNRRYQVLLDFQDKVKAGVSPA
jgi:hypothetical protein